MKPNLWTLPQRLQSAICWLMVFAMLIFNPVPVQAQPLTGQSETPTPIANGTNSNYTTPTRFVIQDATTYANFFNGAPPVTPTVNFATQDALAVATGTLPAGSSVSIPQITVNTTGFTAGFAYADIHVNLGGTPVPGNMTVTGGTTYNQLASATISGGTTKITGMMHLNPDTPLGLFIVPVGSGASILNTDGTVTTTGGLTTTNLSSTGGAVANDGGTATVTGGTTYKLVSDEFTVDGGTYTISPGATVSTVVLPDGGTVLEVTGTVTVTGGSISTSGVTTVGGTTTFTGGTTTVSGGATTGGATCNPYTVVAVPKGAIAYSFQNDVPFSLHSGPTNFSSLSYTIGGGSAPYIESVNIEGSGGITVTRGSTSYSGVLTSEELQAFSTILANTASLGGTIVDSGSPALSNLPSETFTATINGVATTTFILNAGSYGGSELLKLSVDAIRGPAERVVRQALIIDLSGVVSNSPTGLFVGSYQISDLDPFCNVIAGASGKTVGFDALSGSSNTQVTAVNARVISNQPVLAWPNTGARAVGRVSTGTNVEITDLTLYGQYYEVSVEEELRGFVPVRAVSIVH